MANKIEVREALDSHEPDDVKVKKILEVLYYLLKNEHTTLLPPFPRFARHRSLRASKGILLILVSYPGMLVAVTQKP